MSDKDFVAVTQNFDEFFDQRHFRRVAMTGDARVNFGGRWHLCEIVNLSGGGARFRGEIRPIDGANVLVQLRGVGIVRAIVVYHDKSCFAVKFNREDYDVDALVDNLMLFANSKLLARCDDVDRLLDPGEKEEREASQAPDRNEEEYRKLLEENRGRHPLHVRRLLKG